MFLKNKNIIFKIRRSKVTDYATLMNIVKANLPAHMNMFVLPAAFISILRELSPNNVHNLYILDWPRGYKTFFIL